MVAQREDSQRTPRESAVTAQQPNAPSLRRVPCANDRLRARPRSHRSPRYHRTCARHSHRPGAAHDTPGGKRHHPEPVAGFRVPRRGEVRLPGRPRARRADPGRWLGVFGVDALHALPPRRVSGRRDRPDQLLLSRDAEREPASSRLRDFVGARPGSHSHACVRRDRVAGLGRHDRGGLRGGIAARRDRIGEREPVLRHRRAVLHRVQRDPRTAVDDDRAGLAVALRFASAT